MQILILLCADQDRVGVASCGLWDVCFKVHITTYNYKEVQITY